MHDSLASASEEQDRDNGLDLSHIADFEHVLGCCILLRNFKDVWSPEVIVHGYNYPK